MMKHIRTTDLDWLKTLAYAYTRRLAVRLIDDASFGVNPLTDCLLTMGLKAGLSPREWIAVLVSLGMSAAGAWMVIAAIADPEPTSKLWLLVAGGAALMMTGGGSALRVLTGVKPPKVTADSGGLTIEWE